MKKVQYSICIGSLFALAVFWMFRGRIFPMKRETPVIPAQPRTVVGKPIGAPSAEAGRSEESVKRRLIIGSASEQQETKTARTLKTQAQQAVVKDLTDERERVAVDWEKLVEDIVANKETPSLDGVKRIKKAFDQLNKADQLDAIRQSLNLFQDEQFSLLYGILFDKQEDAEVLDAIFSDALNRSEDIKTPLMKELVKDKTHPCFFESARILDTIGIAKD